MNADGRMAGIASEILGQIRGCPDADRLQDLADGSLAPSEQDALRAHARTCKACTEALEFLESEGRGDVAGSHLLPADVAWRSDELIRSVTGRGDAGRGAGGRGATLPGLGFLDRSLLAFAAAVVVVGSLALVGWIALGDRILIEDPGRYRAQRNLEPFEPVGEIAVPIATFRWIGHPRAAGYRVVVFDARMEPLWESRTSGAETRLDVAGGAGPVLAPGEWYAWQVVALGTTGEEIQRSPAVQFRAPTSRTGD